jgi:hypothetical protein
MGQWWSRSFTGHRTLCVHSHFEPSGSVEVAAGGGRPGYFSALDGCGVEEPRDGGRSTN